MALPGSKAASEVGLRSLLCPVGSNVVMRTACCSAGIVLPVYSTFKAIERNDQNQQEKWLIYWAAYGSFSLVEALADKLLSWFPLYYHMKFAFLVWLQLPSVDGAKQLYKNHLCPFFLRHQHWVDPIMRFAYGKMRENGTVGLTSVDGRSTTTARTRSSIRALQEVGLRLLLCPVSSSNSMQTACYSAGVVLPVFSTFKAIEREDEDEQQKWLIYWAAYGSFSLLEVFADKLLSRFSKYYHMKFAFLVWLQLPSVDGAKQLYKNFLRPFFLRHQAWVDMIMGFADGEMRANETVRSRIVDERTHTTFMVGTSSSSMRAPEERVNETVRATIVDERICITTTAGTRSSIGEPEEGNFDGSNGMVYCAICLQHLVGDEVTGMPCSHVFHSNCIRRWLERSRSCPMCRLELP